MLLHPALCHTHPGEGLESTCAGGTDYHSLKSGDNISTNCILHSEQIKRKELTRKPGQLREKLSEPKAVVTPAP